MASPKTCSEPLETNFQTFLLASNFIPEFAWMEWSGVSEWVSGVEQKILNTLEKRLLSHLVHLKILIEHDFVFSIIK